MLPDHAEQFWAGLAIPSKGRTVLSPIGFEQFVGRRNNITPNVTLQEFRDIFQVGLVRRVVIPVRNTMNIYDTHRARLCANL